ncbi:hypothetical protein B9T31_14670 [Acinetobacter sp. ANC 4558]|uniref:Imm47 family immunity protein n=1 Tax=Acinetobacter sp. ANC 4558 TaxID=1977876 RepID=UPI000A355B2E|nr:Imm47 family immunity protein [Acinetobacter sp. ANC 4558]OTG82533.1 hypothetical protein B9T31_14670 [Acinetobacter sp. ANC 4558]
METNVEEFDILKPGIWFGPKLTVDQSLNMTYLNDDTRLLSEICLDLKSGHFHRKKDLMNFMLNSNNFLLKKQAIRLYCHVAVHSDIPFLSEFLTTAEYDEVSLFIMCTPDLLSYNVIPLLFALLEEYEDTLLEEQILHTIDYIFPFGYYSEEFGYYLGEKVDIDELEKEFYEFFNKQNKNLYYYDGKLAFIGNLTQELFPLVVQSLQKKEDFLDTTISSLLSIWSGEKCPVSYGQLISEREYNLVIDYIQDIAKRKWEPGSKYFYGYKVN